MFGIDFASGVSATIAVAKIGRLDMAVANIFGSNAFMLALLMVADVAYRPGPILAAIDRPSLFAAAAGILVTAVHLAGIMERRDRTIFGMGIDSVAAIAVYLGSLAVLYAIRWARTERGLG
jgi:cation:H+ antiporter